MSDPNERHDASQQEAGSAQDETGGTVEATEAAERKARELGIDLASVEGTGSGGRITVEDVENAQRQSGTTVRSMETLQRRSSPPPPPTPPTRDDIQRQYVVLKATLAGPKDGAVPLRIVREDGSVEDPISDQTFPDNPFNFFAPEPPIVQWTFRTPQPLLPNPLPGTNQPCRREECLPDIFE
jgi:pyruvate/2-oxoglutarate dehydrogenase complex dihydrolipoamide acyltransferase (E2) component